jgi:hypothetical protein
VGVPVERRCSWQQSRMPLGLTLPRCASGCCLALRLDRVARRADALQFVRSDRITSTPTLRGKVATVVEMIESSCAPWVPKLAFVVVSRAHGAQHGDGNGTFASSLASCFPCHLGPVYVMGGSLPPTSKGVKGQAAVNRWSRTRSSRPTRSSPRPVS